MDIRSLRKEKGLSQMGLAVAVGVSMVTIQLWERGVTTPNPENMAKLKEVLKAGN
jgi:DNA-binding transcriptional regulator YiaG